MTNTRIFTALSKKFFARLERKTGWGKEEVKREYTEAAAEVVAEAMDALNDANAAEKAIRNTGA